MNTNQGGENLENEIEKKKTGRISNKTLCIIAVIIILTIVGICAFPESAQSLLDLIKLFLSIFSVNVGGALFAFLR